MINLFLFNFFLNKKLIMTDLDMQDLNLWVAKVFKNHAILKEHAIMHLSVIENFCPESQYELHEKLKKQIADEIYNYMLKNFLLRLDNFTILELLNEHSQEIIKMVIMPTYDHFC